MEWYVIPRQKMTKLTELNLVFSRMGFKAARCSISQFEAEADPFHTNKFITLQGRRRITDVASKGQRSEYTTRCKDTGAETSILHGWSTWQANKASFSCKNDT